MPIRPERRKLYPQNWPWISRLIIDLADDRCRECGVPNGAIGYRFPKPGGEFQAVPAVDRRAALDVLRRLRGPRARLTRIVLTVHHADADPTNNSRANLVALCQRCHLRADRKLRELASAGSCPEFEPAQLAEQEITVADLVAGGFTGEQINAQILERAVALESAERNGFQAGFRRGLAEGKPGEAAAVEDFRPATRGACGEDLEDGEGAAI